MRAAFTADGAQIFDQTLKKGQGAADLAVTFNLAFDALMPAVDAKITIDWSRLHNNADTYASEFKDRLTSVDANASVNYWGLVKGSAKVTVNDRKVSKEEVKAFYDYLREKSIIKFESKQLVSGDAEQKIIDGFFATFLEMIAKKENPPDPSVGRQSLVPPDMSHLENLPKDPAKAKEDSGFFGGVNVAVKHDNTEYKVRQYSINNVNQRTTQVISLNQSKAYRYPVQITGNIAQFYDQAKDNPKCVIRFYLDDPFFQKFDVLAPINIDSPESFGSFANYVTVTVRKKRGAGQQDFADSKTFTRNDMKDGLPVARFSYAGGDTAESSREFEYSSQWGLRNGKVWPEKPAYVKASLEGINVNPPLVGKVVETVGFSDGMAAKGIIRAVAQVHYLQLGEEKELNVSLSAGQANDGVKNTIYVDQDIESYVYRVVFYTNNGKKYATDWQRGDATGTVNATVPDDILDNAAYLSRAEQMKANEAVKQQIIDANGAGAGGGN